jgi:hypothetical protein
VEAIAAAKAPHRELPNSGNLTGSGGLPSRRHLMSILPFPFSQSFRNLWSAMLGRRPAGDTPSTPDVVLHDPASQRPHDLDDPFVDPKAQARVGDAIANAARNKT